VQTREPCACACAPGTTHCSAINGGTTVTLIPRSTGPAKAQPGSRHNCRHQDDAWRRRIANTDERNTLARTEIPIRARKTVPAANSHNSKTEYSAVIYLSGADQKQLGDAERCCRAYASRFGWRVLESIHDNSPGQLLPKAMDLGPHIILTGTLDMISPDQKTRDDLMMFLERAECIVHPISTPSHP
jgi:hypothetical protein